MFDGLIYLLKKQLNIKPKKNNEFEIKSVGFKKSSLTSKCS